MSFEVVCYAALCGKTGFDFGDSLVPHCGLLSLEQVASRCESPLSPLCSDIPLKGENAFMI